MSSGLNFYQLFSTQPFAGLTIFCRNLSEQFCQMLPLAFLSPWSTPGCRYIQGLQHPHSPTSDLERKVACIKASMDQTSRQSFIPFCLSLQNCWLCPSGLSAPPEEFLLASLARRLPPCLTFAQWEPCPGKQYLIQVGKHNTTVTCRFASFPQYFRVLV